MIKLSFVIFLFVGLYAVGPYALSILKARFGIDVKPEVLFTLLIPIVFFVFYDYWSKLFTKFKVDLKIQKNFTPKDIKLHIVFKYGGKDTVAISKINPSGINDVNAELIHLPSNKGYCPPENFITHLSPRRPRSEVNIILAFKRGRPTPKHIIPIFRFEVYKVKLFFKVDDYNNHKNIFIFRKRVKE
jgi:hypothetical protein